MAFAIYYEILDIEKKNTFRQSKNRKSNQNQTGSLSNMKLVYENVQHKTLNKQTNKFLIAGVFSTEHVIHNMKQIE